MRLWALKTPQPSTVFIVPSQKEGAVCAAFTLICFCPSQDSVLVPQLPVPLPARRPSEINLLCRYDLIISSLLKVEATRRMTDCHCSGFVSFLWDCRVIAFSVSAHWSSFRAGLRKTFLLLPLFFKQQSAASCQEEAEQMLLVLAVNPPRRPPKSEHSFCQNSKEASETQPWTGS